METNQPKHLNDNDPWMLAENIPDCDIFFFQIPLSCFVSDTSFSFIQKYKKALTVFERFHMDFYFGKEDSNEVAESIVKALIEKPEFGKTVNKEIVLWSKKLIDFAKDTAFKEMHSLSNKELWALYKKHDEIHTKLYTYGWLPVSVDMFHNNFTKKLKSYLYSVCKDKTEAEEAFRILLTPSKKTILAKEREDFLSIYTKYHSEIKKVKDVNSISENFKKALLKHSKDWGHLGYIYAGNAEVFGLEHYFKETMDIFKSGISAKSILQKEEKQLVDAEKQKKILIKKLKINSLYKRLFNTAIDFSLTKLTRRNAQLQDLYLLHTTLLEEIAKRLEITRHKLQFMIMEEVKEGLLQNIIHKDILSKRIQSCVYYTERNFEKVYIGEEADSISKNIDTEIDKTQTQFSGQTAQPGFAKGIVKMIFRAKDMTKMKEGDILVSIATDPDIVPAMKKAGAIVTDQGGITSHAAIVSRELGVPCIIGTKIATKILKDGDLVEVDAEKGIVRIIK